MPDTARSFPVYPTAWLTDKELNRIGWAATGLLAHMMSLSATGHLFGYLTDSGEKPLSVQDIEETKAPAIMRGRMKQGETAEHLKVLLDEGKVKLDKRIKPNGAYFIPKMVRIGQARELAGLRGAAGGGNPNLRKEGVWHWKQRIEASEELTKWHRVNCPACREAGEPCAEATAAADRIDEMRRKIALGDEGAVGGGESTPEPPKTSPASTSSQKRGIGKPPPEAY